MQNKLLIEIVLSLTLISCHNGKEVQTDTAVVTERDSVMSGDGKVDFKLNYTGIVRDMSKNDGCGWMIELDYGNGEKQLLEPLTLDEAYKVDGKIIEFSFTDSRRPSQCSLPSKPITIDNIIK